MRKFIPLFLLATSLGFAQSNTTGTVSTGALMTVKIDTDPSTVTLTLTGPLNAWFGIGFGGSSMSSVTDMFIWNSSAARDYTPSGFQSTPSADAAGSQSWTIVSDSGNTISPRTVVATRNLISTGDYTFLNNNSNIPIIYASGSAANLGYHGNNPHAGTTLTRTTLGVEDFSLNASSVFPNPTTGNFTVNSKTALSEINVYSHAGAFVKNIKVNNATSSDVSIDGLGTGVYLLELKNSTDKSWKKIIVE
jgi:hypothetical protein